MCTCGSRAHILQGCRSPLLTTGSLRCSAVTGSARPRPSKRFSDWCRAPVGSCSLAAHHRRPHACDRRDGYRLCAGRPGRVRRADRGREPAAGGAARAHPRPRARPFPRASRRANQPRAPCPAASSRCRHRPRPAQRQPAAHRGRAHERAPPAGGLRRWTRSPGSRKKCRCCLSSRTWRWCAGWPGRPWSGRRPGRAHRQRVDLLDDAERTRELLGVSKPRSRTRPAGRSRMSTVVLLVDRARLGALYFLIASGLSLIFGLMDVLNFAHGAFLTIGAYATWWASVYLPGAGGDGVGFLVAVAFGVAAGTLAATLVELGVIRPLYGRHREQILVTVGLSLAVPALVQAIWGADPLPFPRPELVSGTVTLLGAAIPPTGSADAVAALVLAGLLLFGTRTRYGLIVRAGVRTGPWSPRLVSIAQVLHLGVRDRGPRRSRGRSAALLRGDHPVPRHVPAGLRSSWSDRRYHPRWAARSRRSRSAWSSSSPTTTPSLARRHRCGDRARRSAVDTAGRLAKATAGGWHERRHRHQAHNRACRPRRTGRRGGAPGGSAWVAPAVSRWCCPCRFPRCGSPACSKAL